MEPVQTTTPRQRAGLLASGARAAELRAQSAGWPSWTVAGTQLAELESLVSGLLWPLTGYATRGESSIAGTGLAALPPVSRADSGSRGEGAAWPHRSH